MYRQNPYGVDHHVHAVADGDVSAREAADSAVLDASGGSMADAPTLGDRFASEWDRMMNNSIQPDARQGVTLLDKYHEQLAREELHGTDHWSYKDANGRTHNLPPGVNPYQFDHWAFEDANGVVTRTAIPTQNGYAYYGTDGKLQSSVAIDHEGNETWRDAQGNVFEYDFKTGDRPPVTVLSLDHDAMDSATASAIHLDDDYEGGDTLKRKKKTGTPNKAGQPAKKPDPQNVANPDEKVPSQRDAGNETPGSQGAGKDASQRPLPDFLQPRPPAPPPYVPPPDTMKQPAAPPPDSIGTKIEDFILSHGDRAADVLLTVGLGAGALALGAAALGTAGLARLAISGGGIIAAHPELISGLIRGVEGIGHGLGPLLQQLGPRLAMVPPIDPNFPRLPLPPTPDGIKNLAELGKLINWGSGDDSARQQIPKIDPDALRLGGFTKEMAQAWSEFYKNEILRNPGNPSARGRADLMDEIARRL